MLKTLRNKAQSTVIQALVVIIALVFVFWGVGSGFGNKRNLVATVNKEEISLQDYQKAYDNTVESYRQQFGGTIPEGLLEGLGIKQQVLSQLIQASLLSQGGREMGVMVSTFATQEKIKKMEAFQQDGSFNLERYEQILSQNRLTPTSFEGNIKSDLLTDTVVKNIKRFTGVTDAEITSRLGFSSEEIKLEYLALTGEAFKDKVEVSAEKLAAYFKEHQNTYKTDPRVKLKYLSFSSDDNLKTIQISDEEIATEYEKTRERYTLAEKRHARHILFQVEDKENQLNMDVQRQKATKILALAKKGDDFSQLAKEHSEGPSASQGGDLGFFERGNMVKPFADAVFGMQPGEISDIVQTQFGFHIIKLEEIKPGETKTLEDVRDKIKEQLTRQQAKKVAFTAANDAYEAIIKSGSIARYSETAKDQVKTTDYFYKKSPPAGITANQKFLKNAFQLKKGELSSVIETDKGYAIIFVDDIEEPKVPELDAVKDRVTADFTATEADKLAEEAAKKLLKESKESGELADAATSLNLELQDSGYVRLNGGQAKLPGQVIKKGFELSPKNPLPDEIVAVAKTFYVFKLMDRRQPEKESDEKQKQQMQKQLLTDKQNLLLNAWLAYMQSRSKIWINQQLLQ